MKKQVKIIISVVVALAVIILSISLFFPSVVSDLTSGTFGKAAKYHKTQMTEKDVKLRSAFVKDTAELKNMIQGLIYFSLFTMDLSQKIDSCVNQFQKAGICSQDNGCNNIRILEDYSDFIRNNNKTLGTTISMLTGFYLNDESDESADVEQNIRAFGTYVNNLNEKDSIMEDALRSMDVFLLNSKTLRARKTEFAQLKSIRDQLLIKGVQLSSVLQDKPSAAAILSYALSSQENYGVVVEAMNLGATTAGSHAVSNISLSSAEGLQAIRNAESLNEIVINSAGNISAIDQLGFVDVVEAQGTLGSADKPKGGGDAPVIGSVVLYDIGGLEFILCSVDKLRNQLSSSELSNVLSGVGQFQSIAYGSAQGLNVVNSSITIGNSAFMSQELGSIMNAQQYSAIMAQGGIGSVPLSAAQFVGMTQQLGNMGLGVALTGE